MSDSEITAMESEPHLASVARRIGAMIYDSMLVIAVLAVATIPFLMIAPRKIIIPREVGWALYLAYLLWQITVVVSFFGFFWTRRGQTLGMQVWKLRVEDEQGKLLSWRSALRRLLFAAIPWLPAYASLAVAEQLHSPTLKWIGELLLLLVLGNLLAVKFSADHRSWHDRLSRTRIVRL
jgi:uncharacterized RDD family membrane protein YckC